MRELKDFGRVSLATVWCLDAVIKTGSFSGAAKYLGISQPAVSQHVSRFEHLVGGKVFERHGQAAVPVSRSVSDLIETICYSAFRLKNQIVESSDRRLRFGMDEQVAIASLRDPSMYRTLSEIVEIDTLPDDSMDRAFLRGDLDLIFRPLRASEVDSEFMIQIPIVWIAQGEVKALPTGRISPQEVVLGSSSNFITNQVIACLEASRHDFIIAAKTDSVSIASRLLVGGVRYAAIPMFLLPHYPNAHVATDNFLPQVGAIRYGLFFNESKVTFSDVLSVFEVLEACLAGHDSTSTSQGEKKLRRAV